MGLEKFLCFDLRTGLLGYGSLNLIGSCLAAIINFTLSLYVDDPNAATNQTFSLVSNSINIGLNGSLTYGVYKLSRVFLLPYLIFVALALGILTLLIVVFMFYAPALIPLLIVLGFGWYVWYAVLSLYQSMDPRNPNYVPEKMPATIVYVDNAEPPAYYENNGADAV